MNLRRQARRFDRGLSLVETLVAVTVMTVGVGALVQLFVVATHANHRAATITIASVVAQQKMEQLRALTWALDTNGLPMTDTTTDTTVVPERPSDGTGLSPSPAGSLVQDTPGYCDFVDASGRLLSVLSASAPRGAMYIRRWSIQPLPADPDNAIVVQVVVIAIVGEHAGEAARLVGVRTRRSAS